MNQIIDFRGHYNHVNYSLELCFKMGSFGLAHVKGTKLNQNNANMSEVMGMCQNKFTALYTSYGAPINPNGKSIAISSNKHNKCPLIIIINDQKILLWHLAYRDMINMLNEKKSMRNVLPFYFIEVDKQYPEYSLMSLLDDSNSNILVTHSVLLNKDVLGVTTSKINLLTLPEGLHITSSGSDFIIRSYSLSAIYFSNRFIFILSGEKDNNDYIWVMEDPLNNMTWESLGLASELLN